MGTRAQSPRSAPLAIVKQARRWPKGTDPQPVLLEVVNRWATRRIATEAMGEPLRHQPLPRVDTASGKERT